MCAPDGFSEGGLWDNKFFQAFPTSVTWDVAKTKCEEIGATLATFENSQQAQGIMGLFGKFHAKAVDK